MARRGRFRRRRRRTGGWAIVRDPKTRAIVGLHTNRRIRMQKRIGGYNATTYLFKRKCSLGTVTVTAATGGYVGAAQQFRIDQLPNVSEFTTLFDQYTIRYVKWYLVLRSTGTSMVESAVNGSIGMPNLIVVRDYDDATVPASSNVGYDELREFNKAKTFCFTAERRCFRIGIKPAVLSEVYRSGVATSYVPKFNQRIDCVTADVPHFGLRYVIQVPTTALLTYAVTFDIYATFYLAMSNVR